MVKEKKEISKPAETGISPNSIYLLEFLGFLGAIICAFIWISLYNFNLESAISLDMHGKFFTGRLGFDVANILSRGLGYASFMFPVLISLFIFVFIYRPILKYLILNTILFIFLIPFFSFINADPLGWGVTGGWLGKKMLDGFFMYYLGVTGCVLIFAFILIGYAMLHFRLPVFSKIYAGLQKLKTHIAEFLGLVKNTRLIEKDEENEPETELEAEPESEPLPEPPVEPEVKPKKAKKEPLPIVPPPLPEDLLRDYEEAVAESDPDKKDIEVRTVEKRKPQKETKVLRMLKDYKLPSLDLLKKEDKVIEAKDKDKKINEIALLIERKLAQHKIKVTVKGATIGPVVTMYEMELGEGIKVSQVSQMENDLGISVGGKRVRVVPRIYGKPYIGIEVPNEDRQIIRLRTILGSDEFSKQKEKGLPIALGHTVDGVAKIADLSRMPHLLVAGTTGSGKSVGVNTIIMSFLYNMTPDDVKFIMIDPKANEFNIYEGIPHLLLPVVTDPKKAALALKWAVAEMENRYKIMGDNKIKDIDSYNQQLDSINEQLSGDGEKLKKMPYIVVVIDEFADLMTVAGKDVEIAVQRIAQKARAAGIHLIIATQRPTRDVITGTIKANLPVRIAFKVASGLDSRTILDTNGAELLLGNGDMLYIPPGSSEPVRVHGAFVSTDETKAVVKFIKDQMPEGVMPQGNIELVSSPEDFLESEDSVIDGDDDDKDALYDEVIAYLKQTRKCSASMLQRKFKIGYNRASRMVDNLEAEGIIGPGDGAKPRDVLLPEED